LIRTAVSEIRETGRAAAGVRLIKLDDGDTLVAMAKVDKVEETQAEDAPPTDGSPVDGAPSPDGGTPPTAGPVVESPAPPTTPPTE